MGPLLDVECKPAVTIKPRFILGYPWSSGVSMVTRSEVFVLGVVRLSRVVLCSFCTCVGRVGLGRVMVSEALLAVGFLLVGGVIRLTLF